MLTDKGVTCTVLNVIFTQSVSNRFCTSYSQNGFLSVKKCSTYEFQANLFEYLFNSMQNILMSYVS